MPPPLTEHWIWQLGGDCRRHSPDLFYGVDQESQTVRRCREVAAKRVCASCPILEACRDYALTAREPYGVWGAMTPPERAHVLRARLSRLT
ncbi:WhiB family transcriptional regulator [Gordonia polyisoprenivorans]|uniref:WhiB family transcriptional regulator n=1 Tax=Gordonia polyisoprenivorans TaxID=84595 RepID=UPI000360C7CE